ncbi:MAG: epimerase [Flammeovirgaceae bacterium]|nr:epimerase [Flammeovirgaceae bacterium]|tara:strand:- start:734 stop:1609 length:876 start_codon:yes stop_codon:yes gene_type:complete
MKLLVTGITGFLGSHLAEDLVETGHEVTGLVRNGSDLSRLETIKDQLVLSEWSTSKFEGMWFDSIIHVATDYGRDKVFSDLLAVNLIWPLQILDTLSKTNPNIYFINTDTFYNKGNGNYEYLGGYTNSKRLLETALKTYKDRVHINMKLEHVYGPRDNPNKFVPSMICKIVSNELEIDLTDGYQKRDFIYVKDVTSAYLTVLNSLDKFEDGFHTIEVGTSCARTIRELMQQILDFVPNSSTKLNWGVLTQRKGEFEESRANIHILSKLGWSIHNSFSDGVFQTVNSYKNRQ